MPINFADAVYSHAQNLLSWPVTFTPVVSSGGVAYAGRGIYNSVAIDVPTESGVIYSDQRTILDILETDFEVLPVTGDQVTIPPAPYTPPSAVGSYEIIDTDGNGAGETTLTLRRLVPSKP